MSVVNNNLLLAADAGVSQYQISRSLRFNSADSAYLSRTPTVAGNRKTWTWAGWVKRSSFSAFHHLMRINAGVETAIRFDNIVDNCLQVYAFTSVFVLHLRTSSIFRDPAAWYHIVIATDTTQATDSDRVKIYVNGVQQTSFSTAIYPTQNSDTGFNQAALHAIGAAPNPTEYFNGYLADVHFIDGQALTPSSFTETNATTGQLVPKAYTGTYGTNGFRLNFSDNSAATAATLGADSSGVLNGNNGTLVNGPTFNSANGGSLIFDGTNDEVTTTTQFTNPQTFTMGAWFKTSTASGKKIIGFEASQTGTASNNFDRMVYMGSNGKLYFAINFVSGGQKYAISSSTYNDNNWHYVVGTYGAEGTTMRLYVDGVSVATATGSSPENYNGYWRIGGYRFQSFWTGGSDGYFPGSIGVAQVYNRGVTASEVTQNYNALVGRFGGTSTGSIVSDGMVLNLDAGNTASYPGTGTTWTDISLRQNNWTPNNLSVLDGRTAVLAATGGLPIYNTTDTYGTVKGSGTRTDSNAASLVLAIPMDGANNGTTFTDESATIRGSGSAISLIRNGDTKTVTNQSKFYGSSGFFDGTGDALTSTASAAINPFTAGDFTIEHWVYFNSIASAPYIFSTSRAAGGGPDRMALQVTSTGALLFFIATSSSQTLSSSAGVCTIGNWVHLAASRQGSTVRLFVNGVQVASNSGLTLFTTVDQRLEIGSAFFNNSNYLDGYIQDLRVYKGVAKYTANFTPPTATQNTTIAAGCDSLTDTPTSYGTDTGAGGEVRGNYATLNPLAGSGSTLSNGNLDITAATAGSTHYKSTIAVASGKWYFEATLISAASSTDPMAGIATVETAAGTYPGQASTSFAAYAYNANSFLQKVNNNAFANLSATTFAANDVLGVAFDLDNGKIWFSKNGVWTNSGNPATGANAAFTGLTGTFTPVFRGSGAGGSSGWNANFGQRPFAYAAPSGFKALCDTNIPEGTITTSGTFTGNASTDGPFVYLNGVPTAMTINSNAVTFATHADKLANGFKLRSSSASYNTAGTNTYSITTTGAKFKYARAQPNP